jgi:hypothetical protein
MIERLIRGQIKFKANKGLDKPQGQSHFEKIGNVSAPLVRCS